MSHVFHIHRDEKNIFFFLTNGWIQRTFQPEKKQKPKYITETTHRDTINVSFHCDMTYFDRQGHAQSTKHTLPYLFAVFVCLLRRHIPEYQYQNWVRATVTKPNDRFNFSMHKNILWERAHSALPDSQTNSTSRRWIHFRKNEQTQCHRRRQKMLFHVFFVRRNKTGRCSIIFIGDSDTQCAIACNELTK